MKSDPWVSLEQIVGHLQVSADTIPRWIRERRIPVHWDGRSCRLKVPEVDEWVWAGKSETGRDVRNGGRAA